MLNKIREFITLWSKQERTSTFNDALEMLTGAADQIETLTTERNAAIAKCKETEAVCQEQYETLALQAWQRNVAREARKKAEDERDTAVAQAKKAKEQRDRAKALISSALEKGEKLSPANAWVEIFRGAGAALADEPPKEGK